MDRPRTDSHSGASIFVTHRPLTSIHLRRLGFRARRLSPIVGGHCIQDSPPWSPLVGPALERETSRD
eukprot:scaffold32905_cov61-Phaeocystis_antarctica.AAC.2